MMTFGSRLGDLPAGACAGTHPTATFPPDGARSSRVPAGPALGCRSALGTTAVSSDDTSASAVEEARLRALSRKGGPDPDAGTATPVRHLRGEPAHEHSHGPTGRARPSLPERGRVTSRISARRGLDGVSEGIAVGVLAHEARVDDVRGLSGESRDAARRADRCSPDVGVIALAHAPDSPRRSTVSINLPQVARVPPSRIKAVADRASAGRQGPPCEGDPET